MNEEAHLIPLIAERLRVIGAVELQELAEDMALIKFPERFRRGTFERYGKNIYNQTTKGWPDAYVLADGKYDAVEATRDLDWKKHLRDDLKKASEPGGRRLSGFFFVGGCSKPEQKEDVSGWIAPW
ncbi:hypothetical protein AB4Y42_35005 [Paraburkholderia sp. EG286B]|uniref:hypothetical protein n=1 Tax=Paraburkholderia sp. EG286B TaxID=3237011 RepID=UPI0034D2269D